jgi:uncharacterized protein DUF3108
MKAFLFLLCSLVYINSFSQNCSSHYLFTNGVTLEYSYSTAQRNGTLAKNQRIKYEVQEVADRDGSTYSTVVKKGISINDEDGFYKRAIDIKCDGKNLYFPYDFYGPDNIFAKDMEPKNRRAKGGSIAVTNTPLQDVITYIVPLVMEGITKLPEGTTQFKQKGKSAYMTGSDFENDVTIKSINLTGKESVKTEAGTFECYKFYVISTQKISTLSMDIKFWLYFNKELGLVKLEGPGAGMELTSIKK